MDIVNTRKRHATFCSENVKNKYNFENLDVSGRIILKWIVMSYRSFLVTEIVRKKYSF
jgi:hypothetical protein